jgi:hypothetical protein
MGCLICQYGRGALTEEDKNMIIYFWTEKGDLERWIGWPEAKARLEQSRPEVLKAWNDYKMAIRTMDVMVESLRA